jgi:hypothetical protein
MDEQNEQEPGGLVPPYEGRQTEVKEGHEEHAPRRPSTGPTRCRRARAG